MEGSGNRSGTFVCLCLSGTQGWGQEVVWGPAYVFIIDWKEVFG